MQILIFILQNCDVFLLSRLLIYSSEISQYAGDGQNQTDGRTPYRYIDPVIPCRTPCEQL